MGSRQYKVVLKKLQALTERLQQAKEVDTLLLKFKMEEWMARVATATANELVLLALDRIKNKATDYDVFIRMLLSMPGAKSLAEEMKGECPLSTPEEAGTITSDSTAEEVGDGGGSQKNTKVLMCYNDFTTPRGRGGGDMQRAEAWTERSLLWEEKEITVLFMDHKIPAWYKEDGNPISKDDILHIANKWHRCNEAVVPKFVPYRSGKSHIRITFSELGGSWSEVGTVALTIKAEKPTMQLNFRGWAPDYYKSLIQHEFGHALGLEHEHQRPDVPNLFDDEKLKEIVRNQLKQEHSPHSDKDVENKIKAQWEALTPADPHIVVSSPYDKDSVMHYVVYDERARAANYAGPTETPLTLSRADRDYIVQFYSQTTPAAGRGPGVIRAEGENGDANGQGTTGATPATLGSGARKLNIDRDVRKVKNLLKPLEKDEIKELFGELGLFDATLRKKYSDNDNVYADYLVRLWIRGDDDAQQLEDYPGGATWENLKKALTKLGRTGIAEEIKL